MGTMGTVRTPRAHHTGRTMGSRSHHAGWWRSPLLSKSILETPHSLLQLSDLEMVKCQRVASLEEICIVLPSVESPGSGAAGGDFVNADQEPASPS